MTPVAQQCKGATGLFTLSQMPEMLEIAYIAALIVGLLLVHKFLSYRGKHAKLPPSPPRLPLLGHILLLGKLPHQSLLELARKHGAYMMLKLGVVNVLVVSTSEGARQVLKVHDQAFASRPMTSGAKTIGYGGKDMAWAPYGEHWRHVRKFCTLELLTPKRVEMFRPVREREMGILLQDVLKSATTGDSVNLTHMVSDVTFNIMLRLLMDKSFSGANEETEGKAEALVFKETIRESFEQGASTQIGDFFPYLRWMDKGMHRMDILMQQRDDYMEKQISEHRKRWNAADKPVIRDFIDVMLYSGDISSTSMKGLTLNMMAAGTDTSAVTVEWAMAEMMQSPSVMSKAQNELMEVIGEHRKLDESDLSKLQYLQAVVKETLRLHPPAPLLVPHESMEDCRLNDEYVIPAKTRLIVNAYAIGRDPAVWTEPSTFNPERFMGDNPIDIRGHSFEVIPFGSGRRMCPGILLGLTTVHLVLGSLLHTFNWSLPNGIKELDMTEAFGMTLPRATPLVLHPSLRLTESKLTMAEP